jgi:hypothetical protein
MPLFYFILKNGHQSLPDAEGVDLIDQEAARAHAIAAGRELIRHNRLESRSWRIEVRDDYLHPCFDVLLAEIDERIKWVAPPNSRTLAEIVRTSYDLVQSGRDHLQQLQQQRRGFAQHIGQSLHVITATRELLQRIDNMITVCIDQPGVPPRLP